MTSEPLKTIYEYETDNGKCDWCGVYCHHKTRTMGFCQKCFFSMRLILAGASK